MVVIEMAPCIVELRPTSMRSFKIMKGRMVASLEKKTDPWTRMITQSQMTLLS